MKTAIAIVLLAAASQATTLTWDAPTAYMTGEPITNPLTYHVCTGTKSGGPYTQTNTTTEITQEVIVPKNRIQYSVVYAQDGIAMSLPSNELRWADIVAPNPPGRLRKWIDTVLGWFRRRKGLRVA